MCMVLVGAKPGMPCNGNNASVHFNTMFKTPHALVVAVVRSWVMKRRWVMVWGIIKCARKERRWV